MRKIQDLFDFTDKTIVISGAAGAIGSEASRFLASLGANVVLADLDEDKVKKIAADIKKESSNATLGMKIDLTDEKQIEALVKATVDKFGRISAVVNNVGWGANTPLWESNTEKMVDIWVSYFISDSCLLFVCYSVSSYSV